jgi:hypothetical protein
MELQLLFEEIIIGHPQEFLILGNWVENSVKSRTPNLTNLLLKYNPVSYLFGIKEN